MHFFLRLFKNEITTFPETWRILIFLGFSLRFINLLLAEPELSSLYKFIFVPLFQRERICASTRNELDGFPSRWSIFLPPSSLFSKLYISFEKQGNHVVNFRFFNSSMDGREELTQAPSVGRLRFSHWHTSIYIWKSLHACLARTCVKSGLRVLPAMIPFYCATVSCASVAIAV